jgi:putative membrane protein
MNKLTVIQFLSKKENISIFIIWLVTISGVIGIWLGHGDWFLPKTIFNLSLGAAILIWNFPLKNGWKSLVIWSAVYLIGMIAEIIGTKTGILFGNYSYGNNLGPKIIGVPPLIGINWIVLTFLTATIARRVIHFKWLSIICGALLMVGLDFFIEPIAPIFDFWSWDEGFAPLKNFIHWFIVSLLMQAVVYDELPEKNHYLPIHHFASQVLFFTFFYAIYKF